MLETKKIFYLSNQILRSKWLKIREKGKELEKPRLT